MTSSEEKADIKTASYKFNTNLLKLSVSDDIEEAKREWEFIMKTTKEYNNNICICQHKIKHIKYFLNRINQTTIICGSECCKNFNFEAQEIKNKTLLQLYINNLIKGEYEQIDNILIYSENVKIQLIKKYQNEYEFYKNDIKKLEKLLQEVVELIYYYNFECLSFLKQEIEFKLENSKIKKEMFDWDNIRAQQEKNKQAKYIYYEQQRMNYINIQREEIEKQQQKEKVIEIKENKIENKINYWFCRFCSLSKIEQHGLFFNDMLCVQCARSNGYY